MALRIFRRLSDLLDVLIASPADGEVLTYSSGAGKWENQAAGGGSPPDLAAVLAEGGDPDGNPVTPVTGPLTIDLAGHPAIAGLLVLDHNGVPIFGVSGAGIGTPTLLGVPTLHADEHGVTVSLDGLSAGFVLLRRAGDSLVAFSANGGVEITPPADSTDDPLTVYDKDGVRRIVASFNGNIYLGGFKSRITPDGAFTTSVHTAPGDDDLSAGECAVWFDQTDGAAKLMVKAKTADGTVATGNVPLT